MNRKRGLFVGILLLLAVVGCSSEIFVSEREIEIESEKEFDKMRQSMAISNDVKVRGYVYCVSDAIIAELEEPYASMDWEIEIFDEDAINAFAMTGGKIGVFTGILKVAEDQDQLGAVIGHEVAHVTQRHAVERVNQAMSTQTAAAIGGAVLGGGVAGQGVQMAAQVALTLPYGRKQESEADTVGLVYSANAGFDPRASVQLWKNMAESNKGAPPEFLSTHPSSDTRIEDLIGELPGALVNYNNAKSSGKVPNCAP